ncbi:spinster family MFS transporter [Sphingomonas mali]|uniref:spinster family MFS transporter n=1 Tax=Sphingomonas mali TaxID=40682 RepID=UPI000A6D7540|nr:MFS transporter [Sphingomonas mali]
MTIVPPLTATDGLEIACDDVDNRSVEQRPGTREWVVLLSLLAVYILNFLDRSLLSILAKPIQDSLRLTDSQLGLIGGLYFAFFYCFIAIPIGWLADRSNRVHILALACAIWSAATMCCGFAATYPQLVVARMTVGFGEAGGVPPSYAIITDTFTPQRRGFAFGIYNLGPGIGAAIGVAFGASIAAAFDWRYAFIAIGAVGLVAALVVLFVIRDPARGATDPSNTADGARSGFLETLAAFFSKPTLLLASFGSGATQFITYGLGNFATLFLMREKGMTLAEVAIWYALVVAIGMSASMLVSGRLIDHFAQRSRQAYALVPASSLVLAIPFYLAFLWAPGWQLSLALLLVPMTLNFFFLSPSVALVQAEVKPSQRVMAGALYLLVINFIGLGLGPTYVGAASDYFRASHPTNSLQIALYTLTPFYLVAILLFLWLARLLKREDATAREPSP